MTREAVATQRMRCIALLTMATLVAGSSASPSPTDLDVLLGRAGEQVTGFLAQLSDVNCVEEVRQEKLGPDSKVEQEWTSTYHYLVILSGAAGELIVDESRKAVPEAQTHKGNPSLLVSNGFAMLFLIFHPYYSVCFDFTALDEEVAAGQRLQKVAFRHIRGRRSPAALELRGREYPLELAGTAWIDPQSGAIARIVAGVDDTMVDVGLKTLRAEEQFAPPPFPDVDQRYWFPVEASIEVATLRQHWRNIHRFKDYRRFSVSTEEQLGSQ